MAGYGQPPGPYPGFQPSAQPIGFEMQQPAYPPHDNSLGYPPPPSQDIYQPHTNDYNGFSNPQVTVPSYHHHGYESRDNLPPVGFEGVAKPKDQDAATTSGVKLDDREARSSETSSKHRSDMDLLVESPKKVCCAYLQLFGCTMKRSRKVFKTTKLFCFGMFFNIWQVLCYRNV